MLSKIQISLWALAAIFHGITYAQTYPNGLTAAQCPQVGPNILFYTNLQPRTYTPVHARAPQTLADAKSISSASPGGILTARDLGEPPTADAVLLPRVDAIEACQMLGAMTFSLVNPAEGNTQTIQMRAGVHYIFTAVCVIPMQQLILWSQNGDGSWAQLGQYTPPGRSRGSQIDFTPTADLTAHLQIIFPHRVMSITGGVTVFSVQD